MQLDRTHIVIRERSYLDILDLALRVIRVYAWPLAVAFACGVVPAMGLNAWLLAPHAEPDFEVGFPASYVALMLLLVVSEMPLVTAPMTLYLGQALFERRPRPAEIAGKFFGSLPQLAFYQLLLRSPLMALALLGLSPFWLLTLSGGLMGMISLSQVIIWFVFFVGWPYLGEVILLERNPMRGKKPGQMTTGRRRRLLHGGYGGELLARWLGAVGVGSLLFLAFWLSLWPVAGMLFGQWEWTQLAYTLFCPLALWLVIAFFAVARFLAYLDLRIRREGWEVELMMRAEAVRLTRQLT